MSHAIETHDLTYRAGRDFAIQRLGLTVHEGSIYGFLGPNGSGKTNRGFYCLQICTREMIPEFR